MMRGGVRRVVVVAILVLAPAYIGFAFAQAPAARGRAAAAPAPAAAQQPRVYANMLEVMRGILYPASNVIFTAQFDDPSTFKPSEHTSTSSDPFTSAYGGWAAVENSGMALAEAANLLIIPRMCGNGKPAPIQNADWKMWVQELRDAGVAVYKVGQTKDADKILDVADTLATACLHCHAKYRNVPGGLANRC
jgi:hypothetical protein